MTYIPCYIPPRPQRLVRNWYCIVPHQYPDIFHVVVYFVQTHQCQIIIRRMDADHGWGLDLHLNIDSDCIRLGPSEKNCQTYNISTNTVLMQSSAPDQKIPRKIMQTYISTHIQSQLQHNAMQSWLELNLEYAYHFLDNIQSREFIRVHHTDDVLKAYDILVPGAFKADLFRLCWIYIHGGVYVDHKMVCLAPLSAYVSIDDTSVWCKERWGIDGTYNAIFASTSHSDNMMRAIQGIVHNVGARYRGSTPLDITGPYFLYPYVKRRAASSSAQRR